jgi:hypothetical protein
MEKKREGDREAAGEVFLSSDPLYHCFFWYWGWERGAAKVALSIHLLFLCYQLLNKSRA